MKINTLTENQNFKWNKTTHLEMSMLAMKECNVDDITKRQIARYSQMPDFDKLERGFHHNTHFFYPHSKKKSFGPGQEKFNAFSQFKEHLLRAMDAKDKNEFLKYLGYALHYLQDMSVPMHTEQEGLLKKILKYKLHKNFERGEKYGAASKHNELTQNYKYESVDHGSVLGLFIDTADFSQQPQFKVTRFNKGKWPYIQQMCFNRGVNSSKVFIEKILAARETITP